MQVLRVVDLDARPAGVVRTRLASDRTATRMAAAWQRVARELAHQHIEPVGPPFARYTAERDGVVVEVGFLVSEPIEDHGDVVASGLPAGPAVIAAGIDGPDSVDEAARAVSHWLGAHGFRPVGPCWEVYETPGSGPVELFVPYTW